MASKIQQHSAQIDDHQGLGPLLKELPSHVQSTLAALQHSPECARCAARAELQQSCWLLLPGCALWLLCVGNVILLLFFLGQLTWGCIERKTVPAPCPARCVKADL